MKKVFLIFTLFLSLLLFTGCGNKKEIDSSNEPINQPIAEEKKLQIINEDSNSRVIAVQINNHNQARPNHAGLQNAFVVYEAIVEGGITRMLAMFKDQTIEKIGSVRSSRPYFLDYVLENDAIYVHFGFSEKAKQDIAKLGINNINGLYDNAFWRDKTLNVDYEHTAFTNTDNINSYIAKKGYRNTSDASPLLNYSVDEIDIKLEKVETLEDGTTNTTITNKANTIIIPYSYYMTVQYDYDNTNKVYYRTANGTPHVDAITKNQYHFKNIIIAKIKNYTTNEGGGRQALENIGTGSGYYITNGHVKEITWEKNDRNSKTKYKYLDGTEIKVNDGNTFIQIVPINSNITIK